MVYTRVHCVYRLAGPQASDDAPVSASYFANGALTLQNMLPRMSGFACFWGFKLKLSHLCGKHFPVEPSPQPYPGFIFFHSLLNQFYS